MDVDDPSPRAGGGGADPPRIRRLEESVVNRIAAGEVIQRPSSAVKELVENSLDAGASTVSVTVKDGGLKLIQVSDDGHGIRSEDLPILCERHTTSKLSAYEDLQTIKSMGFRGEALASMTYVGHVTVTTITEGQLHGYRVSYKDGVMENEPKPCAAVKGTQIMVENLFYNMVARRKTLQNSNDDYPKIVDFISRFAVHHINVNFSCRKHGANRADVHSASTSSRLDAIRNVYGASVVRDLMEIEVSDENAGDTVFKMDGYISNANYVAKKITMILFINDRLVDCTSLKRAIEFVYSATLPQASKPFIYMSINLPPEHVDVNIHPTKKEVSLLNQERIIEIIKNTIEEKLRSSNTTRIFQTQAINPSALTQAYTQKEKGTEVKMASGMKSQKTPVSQMVRTDPRDPSGRLHTYWRGQSSNLENKSDLVSVRNVVRSRRNPKDACDLSSRHELLTEVDSHCHPGLLEVVKSCTYVGLVDEVFALIQHNTRLYLVNVVNVSKELMYQQALCRFGNFNAIQLSEPAPLRELLLMALKEDELMGDENDEEKLEIAEVNSEILKENAEMINEYFSIHVDKDGNLTRLPVVLDQYTPDMDRLPEFVLTMANDVTWDDEKECFRTAAAAIGMFYALHPPILPNPSGSGIQLYKKNKECMPSGEYVDNTDEDDIDQELLAEAETAWSQREWTIQHVLFPSMRLFLKPPKSMATDGTFVQAKYIRDLLDRSGLADSRTAATPMELHLHLKSSDGAPLADPTRYRHLVGSLVYLTATRPDIAYAVHILTQFVSCPTTVHYAHLLRVLRYLRGTTSRRLFYGTSSPPTLHAYSDATWASDPVDRRSVTGYCIFLGGSPVAWKSKRQTAVSRSSAEAELRALATTTAEIIWLRWLLADFGVDSSHPTLLRCDNTSAIQIANNPVKHELTKHIGVDASFIRSHCQLFTVDLQYTPSELQHADFFTKAQTRDQHQFHVFKLNVADSVVSHPPLV